MIEGIITRILDAGEYLSLHFKNCNEDKGEYYTESEVQESLNRESAVNIEKSNRAKSLRKGDYIWANAQTVFWTPVEFVMWRNTKGQLIGEEGIHRNIHLRRYYTVTSGSKT